LKLKPDESDIRTAGLTGLRMQPAAAVGLALAVIAGVLAAVELLRPVHGVDSSARAAIETTIAVVALLTARVVIGILDHDRQARELLLLLGVLALFLAGFSAWAGPVIAGVRASAPFDGVRLAWELIGALVLAAAAFASPASVVRPLPGRARIAARVGVGAIAAGTVLVEIIAVQSGGSATALGHTVAVGVQLVSVAILAIAGLAFVARPSRPERGDGLLAGASLLLAAAGVQFLAVPTVSADWVTPRDGVRLTAFALLLGAVCLRNAEVQRRRAYIAVCSERERVARDLHDGLAQDLACIAAQAQRLDCQLPPEHPLMLATRDALTALRGIVADLTASTAGTSEEAVQLVARELGRRLGLQVTVRTETDVTSAVGSEHLGSRDDLIRATRGAIVAAAVSGEARSVDLILSRRTGNVVVDVSHGTDAIAELGPAGVAPPRPRVRGASRFSPEWSRRSRRPRAV
jgi:signal transduction histidine kinase